MNRRRLVIAALLSLAPLVVVAASCSFPTVNVIALDDGSPTSEAGGDTSTGDSGQEGGQKGDASDVEDGGADAEAGLVDAKPLDEASVEAGCCDCDGDGYLNGRADCDAAVGQVDCDDLNTAIHPGAPFAQNPVWPSAHKPDFDWNCDNVTTKQLGHNLTCGGLVPPLCGGTEGFTEDPKCGETTSYFRCAGLGCGAQLVGNATQACH